MNATRWRLHDALRDVLRFRRPDVPLTIALRNAAGVTLPLLAGWGSGHLGMGIWLALGALVVMFSDQPGPYRQRLSHVALASLGAAAAGWAGFVFGGQREVMIVLALLLGFGGGLLVQFGVAASRIGMTGMILLVIAGAAPMPLRAASQDAVLILAGGLLQMLLAVAAWPLGRYRPERALLARIYRELALLARQRPDHDAAPPLSEQFVEARSMLLGGYRARGRASEAFLVLLDAAEQLRLHLLAETTTTEWRGSATAPQLAGVLDAIAAALEAGSDNTAAERALAPLYTGDALPIALLSALARAVRNSNWAGSAGELRATAAEHALPATLRDDAPWAQLRATFNLHSAAFRHALRMGVALAAGVAAEHYLGLAHGYWLPMTLAIVLRADFAATLSYGVQRALGTVLGLLLTTLLLHLAPALLAKILLLGALAFLFRWLANASYTSAVAALTGAVVILLDLAGEPAAQSMHDRLIATLLACAAALLGYLLWPTWERTRIQPALADMLSSYAAYLRALAGADTQRLAHARSDSRRARINALASLERLRGEPFVTAALRMRAERVFAHANRLIRSAMNLELLPATRRTAPDASRWLLQAAAELDHCARHLDHGTDLPVATVDAPARSDLDAQRLADALQSLRTTLAAAATDD